MKAYGVPRTLDLVYPDMGDVGHYALKSSLGGKKTPGGDIHNTFRNVAGKAASRRIFKRRARRAGKALCTEE
jgi:hypothetical protein